MIQIRHNIYYRYSTEVVLEPQTIRLTPRCDFLQKVQSSKITVLPKPVECCDILDLVGNFANTVWFEKKIQSLEIQSFHDVVLESYDQMGFVFHPCESTRLPLTYPPDCYPAVNDYLHNNVSGDIKEYTESIIQESGNDCVVFLNLLVEKVHEQFEYEVREFGNARAPAVTFSLGMGSCRDLSVLFIDICRYAGIASRFVSGYFLPEHSEEVPELHAWAEVYLPGAGWRGYDPTHGIAAYGRHIVLATGISPDQAAPVSGAYRGGATCRIDSKLTITEI